MATISEALLSDLGQRAVQSGAIAESVIPDILANYANMAEGKAKDKFGQRMLLLLMEASTPTQGQVIQGVKTGFRQEQILGEQAEVRAARAEYGTVSGWLHKGEVKANDPLVLEAASRLDAAGEKGLAKNLLTKARAQDLVDLNAKTSRQVAGKNPTYNPEFLANVEQLRNMGPEGKALAAQFDQAVATRKAAATAQLTEVVGRIERRHKITVDPKLVAAAADTPGGSAPRRALDYSIKGGRIVARIAKTEAETAEATAKAVQTVQKEAAALETKSAIFPGGKAVVLEDIATGLKGAQTAEEAFAVRKMFPALEKAMGMKRMLKGGALLGGLGLVGALMARSKAPDDTTARMALMQQLLASKQGGQGGGNELMNLQRMLNLMQTMKSMMGVQPAVQTMGRQIA